MYSVVVLFVGAKNQVSGPVRLLMQERKDTVQRYCKREKTTRQLKIREKKRNYCRLIKYILRGVGNQIKIFGIIMRKTKKMGRALTPSPSP
jgi:hypothetical protein